MMRNSEGWNCHLSAMHQVPAEDGPQHDNDADDGKHVGSWVQDSYRPRWGEDLSAALLDPSINEADRVSGGYGLEPRSGR